MATKSISRITTAIFLLMTVLLSGARAADPNAPAPPVFSLGGGVYNTEQTVMISCATAGAVIRYTTDDSDPNTYGTEIASGSNIYVDRNMILKAVAWEGSLCSPLKAAFYQIVVSTPVFSLTGGTYYTDKNVVTISCTTEGAVILYTTDGGDPSEGAIYEPNSLIPIDHTLTLKAQAFKGAMTSSGVRSAVYNIVVSTPVFSLNGGAYHTDKNVVTISCATAGAVIRYTTDGSDPSEGVIYEPNFLIPIDHTLTLKAQAFKGAMTPSAVKSERYQIMASTPVFSPDGGSYPNEQTVTISCAMSEAEIHYTTTGLDPTENDPTIENGGSVLVSVIPITILKARAFIAGYDPSYVKATKYKMAGIKYSGGVGDPNNPYRITDILDFQELSAAPSDWNKSFILLADVDFAELTLTQSPIAPDTSFSIGGFQGTPFTGIFDANSHTIINLTINQPTKDYIGLFGYISQGQVRNLGVENANLTGRNYVGGLVGRNNASITSCYASGAVTGEASVGGLVGCNDRPIISCYATGAVTGVSTAGGLVGVNFGSIISCYATGAVASTFSAGGLAGENDGSITSCYATGAVSGGWAAGGLVGSNYRSKVIRCYSTGKPRTFNHVGGLCGYKSTGTGYEDTGNFWDKDTSAISTSAMGTGKTTAEMMTLSTFTVPAVNWDFTATDGDAADWMMLREGEDYPRLAWQEIFAGDIAGLYGVDIADFTEFANNWLEQGCPAGCEQADIDGSGRVDLGDLAIMGRN